MIENGIARFDIAQEIDERDLIGLRPRQCAHDEVEISGGKPRPTIRPDHRDLIMHNARVYGKSEPTTKFFSHRRTQIYADGHFAKFSARFARHSRVAHHFCNPIFSEYFGRNVSS
jgi:hypothetical protein